MVQDKSQSAGQTGFQIDGRKLTAWGLAFLLLISALGISAADVYASETDSAVLLMASMGVVTADSSGNYNLSGSLTRAEFAKMIIEFSPYDNLVATAGTSSPYKDVSSGHWASAYIKLAASKGLMSGYSDGTFRPDQAVTLEQAVNSVLILLGYTQSDFSGSYPYAQMNVYSSSGLSAGISGTTGSTMTKRMAVDLLYNAMNEKLKDGSQTYAESIGYALNSSGQVDYAEVISSNMNGPYTVKSAGWMNDLGLSSGAVVYRNGVKVESSSVNTNDIIYYSSDKGTAWVYSDKVTGIYEKASPSKDAVTSVTVAGKVYELESTAAFSALSSSGDLKIGSVATLLLGKDGNVADAISASVDTSEDIALYVCEAGTKTFEDTEGNTYTSYYVSGITAGGTEAEYPLTESYFEAGDMLTITINGASIKAKRSKTSLSGKVAADLNQIGNSVISDEALIMDTYLGNYTVTTLDRIDGMTLKNTDVLYYKAENGKVTQLVLNNVTGDTVKYGVLLKSSKSSNGLNVSGSYTYDIGGVEYSFNTSGSALGVHKGAAMFYGENGQIDTIKNLTGITRPKEITSQYIVYADKTYLFAPGITAYKYEDSEYRVINLEDALTSSATYYYDKEPDEGGRIRVIVVNK